MATTTNTTATTGVLGITPNAARAIDLAITDFMGRVGNLRIDLSDETKKLDSALSGSNSQQQFRNLINTFNQENIKLMSELGAMDKKVTDAYKQYATIDKNASFSNANSSSYVPFQNGPGTSRDSLIRLNDR